MEPYKLGAVDVTDIIVCENCMDYKQCPTIILGMVLYDEIAKKQNDDVTPFPLCKLLRSDFFINMAVAHLQIGKARASIVMQIVFD